MCILRSFILVGPSPRRYVSVMLLENVYGFFDFHGVLKAMELNDDGQNLILPDSTVYS